MKCSLAALRKFGSITYSISKICVVTSIWMMLVNSVLIFVDCDLWVVHCFCLI